MNNKEKKDENFLDKVTPVGRQTSGTGNSYTGSNIERLLFRAASDEDFKKAFLMDRKSFLESSEFPLSHHDKMMLSAIPIKNLSDMIEKFSSPGISRRNFLKGAAAGAALLAGAFTVAPSFAGGESDGSDELVKQTLGSPPDYPYNFSYDMPQALSRTAGPQGDTIVYDYTGLGIIIPPGALNKPTEITINMLYMGPGLNETNNFFHLNVYHFSPEETEFLKEITIWFPAVNYSGLKAYFYKDQIIQTSIDTIKLWADKKIWNFISDESVWETIPVEIKENYYAVFKTKKFGIYTAGYFK